MSSRLSVSSTLIDVITARFHSFVFGSIQAIAASNLRVSGSITSHFGRFACISVTELLFTVLIRLALNYSCISEILDLVTTRPWLVAIDSHN